MLQIESRVHGVAPELLDLYRGISPSTIGHLTDKGYISGIVPLFRPIQLVGSAVTVRIPHDSAAILSQALELAQPGDVLVIEMAGPQLKACWGEFRTYAALNKKVAGVILSGCVTDVRAITKLGFPVYSGGISAITTNNLVAEGEVNTAVSINGVNIYPGDIIVGDDDGLFALRPEHAAELAPAASDKQRKETLRRRERGYDKLLGWD